MARVPEGVHRLLILKACHSAIRCAHMLTMMQAETCVGQESLENSCAVLVLKDRSIMNVELRITGVAQEEYCRGA